MERVFEGKNRLILLFYYVVSSGSGHSGSNLSESVCKQVSNPQQLQFNRSEYSSKMHTIKQMNGKIILIHVVATFKASKS